MEEKRLTVETSSISFFVSFIAGQLVSLIGLVGLSFILKICNLSQTDISDQLKGFAGIFVCALLMNLVFCLIFIYFKKKTNETFFKKCSLKKVLLYISIAIVILFILYPFIACIDSVLIKLNWAKNASNPTMDLGNFFLSIIFRVLLPAICEEMIFRGIIFKGLKNKGKAFSIILTSFMFAIFHMSISQFVYQFLVALVLCVVMYYEDNLLYPIIIHFVNNLTTLILAYFNVNLIFNHWTYILLAIVLLIIFLSIILYLIIKGNKQSKYETITKTNVIYLLTVNSIMIVFWIIVAIS